MKEGFEDGRNTEDIPNTGIVLDTLDNGKPYALLRLNGEWEIGTEYFTKTELVQRILEVPEEMLSNEIRKKLIEEAENSALPE